MRGRIVAGLLLVAALGCRSGWVKPGSTEQDFLQDYNCCRYGCDDERQTLAAAGREQKTDAVRAAKRNYKLCLRLRGWHVVRGEGYRP